LAKIISTHSMPEKYLNFTQITLLEMLYKENSLLGAVAKLLLLSKYY